MPQIQGLHILYLPSSNTALSNTNAKCHLPKFFYHRETYQRRFQPDPLEMLYTEELRRHLEESPMVAVFQGLSMELINQRKVCEICPDVLITLASYYNGIS